MSRHRGHGEVREEISPVQMLEGLMCCLSRANELCRTRCAAIGERQQDAYNGIRRHRAFAVDLLRSRARSRSCPHLQISHHDLYNPTQPELTPHPLQLHHPSRSHCAQSSRTPPWPTTNPVSRRRQTLGEPPMAALNLKASF